MAKPKKNNEAQLLQLLKSVLPKTVSDPKLIDKIYSACENELKEQNRAASFQKFCEHCELPDLEPATIMDVKQQFTHAFDKGKVTLTPEPEQKLLKAELELPDITLTGSIKVRPLGEEDDEQEIKLKFVPFPVALPTDPELVWMLGKKENMTSEEAAIALTKIEEDFWASKKGQKLIRDRVERGFPEFIARAAAKQLTELGIKRYFPEPEPVKHLQRLATAEPVKKKKD